MSVNVPPESDLKSKTVAFLTHPSLRTNPQSRGPDETASTLHRMPGLDLPTHHQGNLKGNFRQTDRQTHCASPFLDASPVSFTLST